MNNDRNKNKDHYRSVMNITSHSRIPITYTFYEFCVSRKNDEKKVTSRKRAPSIDFER